MAYRWLSRSWLTVLRVKAVGCWLTRPPCAAVKGRASAKCLPQPCLPSLSSRPHCQPESKMRCHFTWCSPRVIPYNRSRTLLCFMRPAYSQNQLVPLATPIRQLTKLTEVLTRALTMSTAYCSLPLPEGSQDTRYIKTYPT